MSKTSDQIQESKRSETVEIRNICGDDVTCYVLNKSSISCIKRWTKMTNPFRKTIVPLFGTLVVILVAIVLFIIISFFTRNYGRYGRDDANSAVPAPTPRAGKDICWQDRYYSKGDGVIEVVCNSNLMPGLPFLSQKEADERTKRTEKEKKSLEADKAEWCKLQTSLPFIEWRKCQKYIKGNEL